MLIGLYMDLVKTIEGITGRESKIDYLPNQPGDVVKTQADISKAQEMLGYTPQVSLQQGLRKTIEWYKTLQW